MYSHTTLIFIITIMSGHKSNKRKTISQPIVPLRNSDVPSYRGQDLKTMVGGSKIDDITQRLSELGTNIKLGDTTVPSGAGAGGSSSSSVYSLPRDSTPRGAFGSTSWDDLLKRAGSNGSDFNSILAQLGIGGFAPMSGVEGADWNKQLLDQIISQLSEEDKRRYNEERWNIQNIYDSPLNQLARLMGAGISRDAAIQMLSGGGSGSGSIVTGDAAALAGGLAPSESNKNAIDAATGIANTVFNGISSLVGLTSLGFSIPQALQSIKGLQMQNHLTSDMLQGLQAADSLLSAAGNAVQTGLMSQDEYNKLTNGNDYINHIIANKDKAGYADVYSSPAFQRVYGTVQGREMFNRGWNAITKSKTEGEQLRNFVELQDIQKRLGNISAEKMGAEMTNLAKQGNLLDAQANLALQKICESESQVQFLNAQGNWIDVNTQQAKLEYDLTESGFPMLKQKYLDTLEIEVQELAALKNNPDAMSKHLDAFVLQNGVNAQLVQYLQSVDNGAVSGFAQTCPTIYNAIKIMQRCGVFDRFMNKVDHYDSPILTPNEKKGLITEFSRGIRH